MALGATIHQIIVSNCFAHCLFWHQTQIIHNSHAIGFLLVGTPLLMFKVFLVVVACPG